MPVGTELALRLPNSPGALWDVARELAHQGVRVLALALESGGQVRLVVDNAPRAVNLLREQHRSVTAREVLVVPTADERHALPAVLRLVAEAGANIDYAYAASTGSEGGTLVLGVAEPLRVATATGL